jgi:hypothetical protein
MDFAFLAARLRAAGAGVIVIDVGSPATGPGKFTGRLTPWR